MSEIKVTINRDELEFVRDAKPNWSDTGQNEKVYKVDIKKLHYNEENGRIATWISTYSSDESNPPLSSLSREEFNERIEKYVIDSNRKGAIEELKNDIRKKTQLNPGVILTDGTIVSGNRRFTALRQLYNETGDEKFRFFECFVVDAPKTKDMIEFVKLIETKTQFGIVAEEDYNAIDRLVTIYRYLIDEEKRIWSVSEYAKKIGISKSEAEKLYYRATIMEDYLEYINCPYAFHIARVQKLDGPIAELPLLYKEIIESPKGKAEWNRIRPLFYSEFPPKKNKDDSKDRTRKVRSLKKMYKENKSSFERLLVMLYNQQEEIEVKESLGQTPHTEFRIDEFGQKIAMVSLDKQKLQDEIMATNKQQARAKPLKKLTDAMADLNLIETDVFDYMSAEEKAKFLDELENLKHKIDYLRTKASK